MHAAHGAALLLALVVGASGLAFWHHERMPRVQAFLIGFAAFLTTIGLTVWSDALASLVQSDLALGVLAAVTAVGGLCFWFQVIRKHKHHPVLTPLISVVFGTALVLFFGSLGTIAKRGLFNPSKAAQAFSGTVARINSGKAAQAAMAGQGSHRTMVLAIGGAVIIALVFFGMRLRGRKKSSSPFGGRPGGAPSFPAAPPGGRKAIPAGRRK